MSPRKILVLVIVLVCTVGPIVAMFAYEAHRTKDVTATILARAPERGNFLPRELTVTVGKLVRLRVRNVDTVMHGFTIPGLNVDSVEISAGHQKILEFTPEETGEYAFYCTVWCGDHHMQMNGTLKVVPQSN